MNKNQNFSKPSLPPRKAIPSFWESAQDKVMLHLGENPNPPHESVVQAIADAGRYANHYPDTMADELRTKLARYVGHGLGKENIVVGNGSDELIDLCVTAFVSPGQSVTTFHPTFFVYGFCAQRHGFPVLQYERDNTYHLPPIDTLQSDSSIGLTFIANPNNPTGTLSPRDQLVSLLDRWPGIIVIDECYFEYSKETIVDLIHDYQNLIVFRSLSKSFGLAGLRLGYAVAHEDVAEHLLSYAMTFPVNICAQAAGIATLNIVDHYKERIAEIRSRRDWFRNELKKMGLDVLPSYTNFVLALIPKNQHQNPATALADKGFLVSSQNFALEKNQSALRIAIGTEAEMKELVQVLQQLLG